MVPIAGVFHDAAQLAGLWLRLAATAAALAVLIAIASKDATGAAAGIDREDEILWARSKPRYRGRFPATMQPVYNLMLEEGAK